MVECSGIVRHIQLKSKHRAGKADEFKIQTALGDKPSGCVIGILYDPETLETGPFLWFGSSPGLPLPDIGSKVAKHSKGNKDGVKAERPGHRVLALSRFQMLTSMEDVAEALFGIADQTTANRLAALAAFAPSLREAALSAQTSGESPGGRWTFHNADGTLALPHFEYDDLLSGFIDMAYASGWVSPEVDWTTWVTSEEARRLKTDQAGVADADEAVLRS